MMITAEELKSITTEENPIPDFEKVLEIANKKFGKDRSGKSCERFIRRKLGVYNNLQLNKEYEDDYRRNEELGETIRAVGSEILDNIYLMNNPARYLSLCFELSRKAYKHSMLGNSLAVSYADRCLHMDQPLIGASGLIYALTKTNTPWPTAQVKRFQFVCSGRFSGLIRMKSHTSEISQEVATSIVKGAVLDNKYGERVRSDMFRVYISLGNKIENPFDKALYFLNTHRSPVAGESLSNHWEKEFETEVATSFIEACDEIACKGTKGMVIREAVRLTPAQSTFGKVARELKANL